MSLPVTPTSASDLGMISRTAVSHQLSVSSAHKKHFPEIWIASRLKHGSVHFLQTGHTGTCLGGLAQQMSVLTQLSNVLLGDSTLAEQLLCPQCNVQQSRLAQYLHRVEEAAMPMQADGGVFD